jgi:hypothetical protein
MSGVFGGIQLGERMVSGFKGWSGVNVDKGTATSTDMAG